jgi:hypothetical protein
MKENINPKSLKGKEALQHTLDLMNKLTPIKESVSTASLEFVKRGPDGLTYTIIRENRKFFIKTTTETEFKISDLKYTGGLQNKLQEAYDTYEAALKHLNLTFQQINESYKNKGGMNLFEQDYFDIEEDEGKKYKLRLPHQSEPTPVPSPEPSPSPVASSEPAVDGGEESPEIEDVPSDDAGMGGDDMGTDDMSGEDDIDIDDDDEEDPIKYIQKLTGKLGQKIRELPEPDPKLEKYVMNSIVSALHIDKMDKKDRMDILKKFKKRKGMESDMGGQESPEPVSNEENVDESGSDENFGMMSVKGPFKYQTVFQKQSEDEGSEIKFKKMDIPMDEDRMMKRKMAIAKELERARSRKNSIRASDEYVDMDSDTEVKPDVKTPPKPYTPKRPSPFQPPRPSTNPGPKAHKDEFEEKYKKLNNKFKKRDFGSLDLDI